MSGNNNNNKNKSEFLGIPHGTAHGRLRKKILFHLVQKCGLDTCYRCGKQIKTVEELSIEHKEPWLYNSVDLFWDIENIAFSHLKCNIVSHRGTCCHPNGKSEKMKSYHDSLRKIDDSGESWCYVCEQFLPKSKFTKNKSRWDGVQSECKKCRSLKRKRT